MKLSTWKVTIQEMLTSSRQSKVDTFLDLSLRFWTEMLTMLSITVPKVISNSRNLFLTRLNKPRSWKMLWPQLLIKCQGPTSSKELRLRLSLTAIPSIILGMGILEPSSRRPVKSNCWSMWIQCKNLFNFSLLEKEGYRLKHLYKTEKQPFAIIVNPGEATAVVLKKIDEKTATHWPPKAITIYQKWFISLLRSW